MADITPESWATDLLTRMNYPVTSNNLTSVLAWEYQEGGHFSNAATYNPLNTTLGHATYGAMNSAGVSTYPDYETGMKETISTLNSHYYGQIRSDLAASADPSTTAADIKASPWGTWHGGASTAPALARARKDVAAHPGLVNGSPPATTTPASTTPPATTPSATTPAASAAPAAGLAVPAAAAATPATGSTATGFEGADVDALDKLAQVFKEGAQIVDEVKAACEAIVAAASIFGPFGAAFVAYLKGTVIPWLTKISQALTSLSGVLSQHSQAQKDASSSATSLPSYSAGSTATPTTGTTAGQVATVAGAIAGLLGLGAVATTAAPSLIGALTGSTTPAATTGTEGASGEKPEAPEQIAPHTAEASKSVGTTMTREALQDVEEEKLGVAKGGSIHPTGTLAQTGGDVAVDKITLADGTTLELDQAKGSAAAFAGIDPKDGGQIGGVATGGLNVADLTSKGDVDLGAAGPLKLSGEATAGLDGQVSAVAAYNPTTQTVSANAGGEVVLGLQAKGSATYTDPWGYVTNTTEVTGTLGASAAADGGIVIGNGHLDIHGGVGAAVGLGGKVADSVDINYGKIGTDAYNAAAPYVTEAYTEAGNAVTGAEQTIGSWFVTTPAPKH
jgi:hypothetical protein